MAARGKGDVMLRISADGKTATVTPIVAAPPARLAGAVAHFIMEALYAGRDDQDALLRDLGTVTALGAGRLEVTVGGQRLEIMVRPAQVGYLAAGGYEPVHEASCELSVPMGCRCSCGAVRP